jgi:recombination protein RecA
MQMKDTLKAAIAAINKKNPDSIGTIKDTKDLSVKRLSSGSHYLDYALGGGWAMGRIVELYGQPGSGKSTISMKTIVEAQKKGMDCAYIDAENAFDPAFATALGVDVNKLIISQESGAEAIFEQVFKLLDGGCDVIVVDSVAALVPKATFEADMDQPQIAMLARSMSRGLPLTLAHNKSNSLVIFINQLRMSPGAYGNPEITAGGKSLGYYSSNRVEVRKGDWIEVGSAKEKIGQQVKFKIAKNKTGVPFRTGYFNFLYEGKIDRVDELISVGIETGKLTQRGPMYDLLGKSYKGRSAVAEALQEDPKLVEAFSKQVLGG